MSAYVSGQAGRAVLLRGGVFHGYELDRDAQVQLHRSQIAAFLGHAIDVERLQTSSLDEVRARLELEWAIDRALVLSLYAFDRSQPEGARLRAAKEANALLKDEACRSGVLRMLSSAEFPSDFQPGVVSSFLIESDLTHLVVVLDDIDRRRALISECVRSWEEMAPSLNYGDQDVARARYRLAKIGIFRDFVTLSSENNEAILKILVDPVLSSNKPLTREIVSKWASQYKNKAVPTELQVFDEAPRASGSLRNDFLQHRRPDSAFEAFTKVDKKIASIKSKYIQANYKRADAQVAYLVSDQLSSGDPVFVAKSLCNIAMFCRGLGDIGRYYDYTKRAVDLVPQDAWALVQLGNAHLAAGEYRDAISCFERAEAAGDERSALLGRAEALKVVGQQHVALSTLERCIEAYPNDEIAKNARASLLAYFGDLHSALDEYNSLISSPNVTSHSYGGRALVLDDLGETERALSDVDASIALAPGDMVPICAKADILRRARRYSEALRVLDVKKVSAEGRLMVGVASIRVHRDCGDYRAAQKRAESLIASYPNDLASKVAIPDVLRRAGRFEEALEEYRALEGKLGFARLARYGYASTFASIGKYEEAISYLSIHAATAGDWTSKLLLGMIHVRRGEYSIAESLLLDGQLECPWIRIRAQFSSALIHLRLRQRNVAEAVTIFEENLSDSEPLDEGAALLAFHLRALQREPMYENERGFVGSLFKKAIENVERFSRSNDLETEELFNSEWLALASLAA